MSREVKAYVTLGHANYKPQFTINKYDDVELKVIVEDLMKLDGYNLELYIQKPGNLVSEKENIIKNILDNIVEFDLKTKFDISGVHKAQVKFLSSDGNFSSAIFVFNVSDVIINYPNEPIPPGTVAVCGEFLCGELTCGEGLKIKEVDTESSLSREFLRSFGGELNE